MPRPRPFISYAHEDRPTAMWLYGELRRMGADPWFDAVSLLPGDHWEQAIRQALSNATHFIALISRHSVNKRGFVQKELRQALNLLQEFPPGHIFFIPVRIENIEPKHDELRQIHRVDLFENRSLALAKIADSLHLGTESSRPSADGVLDEIRGQLQARFEALYFPRCETYDGFVINDDFQVGPGRTDPSGGPDIQGADPKHVEEHVRLIEEEIRRRGDGSAYSNIQKALPAGFKLCRIDLRVIFDHHGRFTYLQDLDGQVIGPNGGRRPLRRVLEKGD